MSYFKSRAVAQALGVPYYRLFELIRSGKLVAPAKDSSGDYCWTEEDVERARAALQAKRQPKGVPA
jgi:predicted site-specific integrase-resolvase